MTAVVNFCDAQMIRDFEVSLGLFGAKSIGPFKRMPKLGTLCFPGTMGHVLFYIHKGHILHQNEKKSFFSLFQSKCPMCLTCLAADLKYLHKEGHVAILV